MTDQIANIADRKYSWKRSGWARINIKPWKSSCDFFWMLFVSSSSDEDQIAIFDLFGSEWRACRLSELKDLCDRKSVTHDEINKISIVVNLQNDGSFTGTGSIP